MTEYIDSTERAAEIIREGGLVAFPTETVFGIGVDATNGDAVAKLFEAKGRPSNNPLIVHLDDGAVKVLKGSGRSLLPVGVKALTGSFARGDVVSCVDSSGVEVARGMINYNSDEALKIIGISSDQIEQILGYQGDKELIHRDNLIVEI